MRPLPTPGSSHPLHGGCCAGGGGLWCAARGGGEGGASATPTAALAGNIFSALTSGLKHTLQVHARGGGYEDEVSLRAAMQGVQAWASAFCLFQCPWEGVEPTA